MDTFKDHKDAAKDSDAKQECSVSSFVRSLSSQLLATLNEPTSNKDDDDALKQLQEIDILVED